MVYVAEVDRLGGAFTGLWQGALRAAWVCCRWTVVSLTGGLEPMRLLRVGRSAGRPRSTAESLEPSALELQLDNDGLRLSVRRTWQAGSLTVPKVARRAPYVTAS